MAIPVSGVSIPILWRRLAPYSAPRVLARITAWISGHDRTTNLTILVASSTAFVVKGLAGP